jgi:hypothetical protein
MVPRTCCLLRQDHYTPEIPTEVNEVPPWAGDPTFSATVSSRVHRTNSTELR